MWTQRVPTMHQSPAGPDWVTVEFWSILASPLRMQVWYKYWTTFGFLSVFFFFLSLIFLSWQNRLTPHRMWPLQTWPPPPSPYFGIHLLNQMELSFTTLFTTLTTTLWLSRWDLCRALDPDRVIKGRCRTHCSLFVFFFTGLLIVWLGVLLLLI